MKKIFLLSGAVVFLLCSCKKNLPEVCKTAAEKIANEYYPITVNVTDGKILLNAGHSKSGNVVDSIHMQIEFSDDPGTIYEMNGGARTRFAEDDY